MIRYSCSILILLITVIQAHCQVVDYSVVSVPEEDGLNLCKVSSDNDQLAMPIVRRNRFNVRWATNTILGISPDGKTIGYIASRSNTNNIFIMGLDCAGPSTQRTSRSKVTSFSFSPDGEKIAFCETIGNNSQIFVTGATQGLVCRQISSGSMDYSPVFAPDMSAIFFCRQEQSGFSIWSYDMENSFFSSYTEGMNPCIIGSDMIICTRINAEGRGEIWRISLPDGIEECIVSDPNKSFSSPSVSPDGQIISFVGSSALQNGNRTYWNTDIYACRIDGNNLIQLTHHAADDLSPVWSRDMRYIYFVSQRGSEKAVANIWRMDFQTSNLQ